MQMQGVSPFFLKKALERSKPNRGTFSHEVEYLVIDIK
jgi:hypothetical protein